MRNEVTTVRTRFWRKFWTRPEKKSTTVRTNAQRDAKLEYEHFIRMLKRECGGKRINYIVNVRGPPLSLTPTRHDPKLFFDLREAYSQANFGFLAKIRKQILQTAFSPLASSANFCSQMLFSMQLLPSELENLRRIRSPEKASQMEPVLYGRDFRHCFHDFQLVVRKWTGKSHKIADSEERQILVQQPWGANFDVSERWALDRVQLDDIFTTDSWAWRASRC